MSWPEKGDVPSFSPNKLADIARALRVAADAIDEARVRDASCVMQEVGVGWVPSEPLTALLNGPVSAGIESERFQATRFVVTATHEEQLNLWHRWHHILGVPWEQQNPGWHQTISTVVEGRSTAVTVFWALIYGALVAFVDGTSLLVDRKAIDVWIELSFPRCAEQTNAANFHNVINGIAELCRVTRLPMRNYHACEEAWRCVPIIAGE